jgi:hypothetical protein
MPCKKIVFDCIFGAAKDQILRTIIVMVVESCRNFYYVIGKDGKLSNLQPCQEGKSCGHVTG